MQTVAGPSTIDLMSSPDNLDDDQPQPAAHGQVHVPDHHPRKAELTKMLTDHLAQHVAHANTTADYGGHGAFSSQGGFQQGGAAGADYETSSTGFDDPSAKDYGTTDTGDE